MKSQQTKQARAKTLDFSNLTFSGPAEQRFVSNQIKRIAFKIKEMRHKHGLTQEEFAEKLSVSVATIKFIEQNQRAPSLPMFFKILYHLDRHIDIWN